MCESEPVKVTLFCMKLYDSKDQIKKSVKQEKKMAF